jgi:hypothetical protein
MISDITYSLARQPQRAAALFLTSLLPTGFTQNMNNINFRVCQPIVLLGIALAINKNIINAYQGKEKQVFFDNPAFYL